MTAATPYGAQGCTCLINRDNPFDYILCPHHDEPSVESVSASVLALATELLEYDCTKHPVPGGIDVPDDYEAGLHEAGQRLRELVE